MRILMRIFMRIVVRVLFGGAAPKLAVSLSLLLLLVLSGQRAFAFCRTTTCAVKKPPPSCMRDPDTGCWATGIPLSWNDQCISFSVNVAGSMRLGLDYDAARAIAEEAFSKWPAASCSDGAPSIAFAHRSGLTCDRVEYNPSGPNANAIIFRDDTWTHDASALALTTVAFNVRTGQILNADMEINTASDELRLIDLPFVITHEAGHFAGLDHSPDPSTVMYFRYSGVPPTDVQLSDDDVAAICDAYPQGRAVPACDFEPPKGYATDCGGDVQAACTVAPGAVAGDRRSRWWAVALALGACLTLRWRARRRRRVGQDSQSGKRARSA
ncbi:MAG TPA: matrixin family metalloprotease [Polyangia bacterium]|jgi:hypothetical protein|nr:matrixin family metalloprotease [Polyangia bacterium]